jgi:hypothetical protein
MLGVVGTYKHITVTAVASAITTTATTTTTTTTQHLILKPHGKGPLGGSSTGIANLVHFGGHIKLKNHLGTRPLRMFSFSYF